MTTERCFEAEDHAPDTSDLSGGAERTLTNQPTKRAGMFANADTARGAAGPVEFAENLCGEEGRPWRRHFPPVAFTRKHSAQEARLPSRRAPRRTPLVRRLLATERPRHTSRQLHDHAEGGGSVCLVVHRMICARRGVYAISEPALDQGVDRGSSTGRSTGLCIRPEKR